MYEEEGGSSTSVPPSPMEVEIAIALFPTLLLPLLPLLPLIPLLPLLLLLPLRFDTV